MLLVIPASVFCQLNEYKEFRRDTARTVFVELTFAKDKLTITGYDGDAIETAVIDRSDARGQAIPMKIGNARFDTASLFIQEREFPYTRILDARLKRSKDVTVVTLLTGQPETGAAARRRGNSIVPFDQVNVDSGKFHRGFILTVTGDVVIAGEVNRDVISLFGNITVGPSAVIRGDIVTFSGKVEIGDKATIYGRAYSGQSGSPWRRLRGTVQGDSFGFGPAIKYDRVDGLTLSGRVTFAHKDSIIPVVRFKAGYAFNSERVRAEASLEQLILRRRSLSVGVEYYRRLDSRDDWIIEDGENTAFALLAGEDFKDWYEAEGGAAWIRFRPIQALDLKLTFRSEITGWLEARANLWSLFGGSKLFAPNFATIEPLEREQGVTKLDTSRMASISIMAKFDTRVEDEPYERSAWKAWVELKMAEPDFSSDYDFTRILASATRYQKLTRTVMATLHAVMGRGDDDLPMQESFFLGGLGTLYGYKNKSYHGTHFIAGSTEVRLNPVNTFAGFSLFWDFGTIAHNGGALPSLKHDAGVGLFLGEQIRLSLAYPLSDELDDKKIRFYARLTHHL